MRNFSCHSEWLMAALAPWAMSPHPNFPESSISGAAKLALVAEYRYEREKERYETSPEDENQSWQAGLISAANASLYTETQEGSISVLWSIADDRLVPIGGRVAAALFASVAASEAERATETAERLGGLIESISEGVEPTLVSPSVRLCVAALLQQRVARLQDSLLFESARECVEQALQWVPGDSEDFSESFATSSGVEWQSSEVMSDVASSIKFHALASKAHLEQFGGSTWVRVVKGRNPWVDERMSRVAAERDGMVVRDSFEEVYDSTSGTRYLMRDEPAAKGYAALLTAELSGHTGRIAECREGLAKALILKDATDPHNVREALRLLRQGQARKPLQSVLRWVRGQGPTRALKDDAENVIARVVVTGRISEADLSVLEAAADFLDRASLSKAIMCALKYLDTEQISGRADWAMLDKLWKTLARLTEGSGEDDFVASRASEYLKQPELLTEPFSSTLARAIEVINWSHVTESTTQLFEDWLSEETFSEASAEETADVARLRRTAFRCIRGKEDDFHSLHGLERAAFLADNGIPDQSSSRVVEEAQLELEAQLSNEVNEASKGMTSFGGYSTANVAVAFALRFSSSQLWESIGSYLLNPTVHAALKDSALDRIANNPKSIPQSILDSWNRQWSQILNSERRDVFSDKPILPISAPAYRAGGALGIISLNEALKAILELSSSSDSARVQAARTIPYVLKLGDPTWGHVLLLQLARDLNPEVKAEAGHSLVLSLVHPSGLLENIEETIRELMVTDGIRAPLRVLHAFQRLSSEHPSIVTRFRDEIEMLGGDDTPRVVRGAAAAVFFGKAA